MRDIDNNNFLKNDVTGYFDELNEFITSLFKENLVEKDELMTNFSKNIEILDGIDAKILLLENNICYDNNIFNPNNTSDENEYRIKQLNVKREIIVNENIEIQKRINSTSKKINDIYEISKKIELDGHREYLSNCKEAEKYKIEILRSQEFERKRIARDLHDTVIQNLTNLIHKTELTIRVMDVDSVRAKLELMTISKNVKEIIDDMRNIIYNLRPMAFDDIGIEVIIERELSKIKENGIEVKYDIEGISGKVDQIVLLTLIRIIQEACNNVVKHSEATKVEVKIVYSENYIETYIIDNGIGFEVSNNTDISYESKSGFGLSMMKERVYMLSGKIDFKSNTNEGTKIYVRVPKCFREDINDTDKYSNS